jgi:hypothetical protein
MLQRNASPDRIIVSATERCLLGGSLSVNHFPKKKTKARLMAPTASNYDLFLSYNSADHRIVQEVAHKLAEAGLKELFFDRWNLLIGTRWRPMLEKALGSSKAVAIFVGSGEMGSWQQRELDIALDLQSKSANFPVIPVLLPGCEPPLGFLGQLTWVDLRTQTLDRGIVILAKAARGEPPGPEIQKDSDSVRASICPYRGLLHFREEDAPFFFEAAERSPHGLGDSNPSSHRSAIKSACHGARTIAGANDG